MPSVLFSIILWHQYTLLKKIVDSVASTIVVSTTDVVYNCSNSCILCFKVLQLIYINWLMKAVIFSLLGWMFLPVMDGFAKFLSTDMPILQITWARYFFTVVFTSSYHVLFF